MEKNLYNILSNRRCDSCPIVAQCVKGFNYRSRLNIKAILGKDKKKRTTMMMSVKASNFVKEARLNWNLGGTRSTLQFKKDVLVDTYMIYSHDTSKKFDVEHVWLLLKDQPKFNVDTTEKRPFYDDGNRPSTMVLSHLWMVRRGKCWLSMTIP